MTERSAPILTSSYEKRVEGATEKIFKYYFAGSVRIAMRENGVITWILTDHLGSTTALAAQDGTLSALFRYTAFAVYAPPSVFCERGGELRAANGSDTAPMTDYQYTGQRNEIEIGLYYYVARFYDPALGRFISADTLVPEPGSSKAYDRYAYVNGNPINYNDPSGHMAWLGEGGGTLAQAEYDKQRNEQLYCQAGYKTYCSYAQNHPIETAAFTVGGVAAAGLVGSALGDVTVGTIIKVGGKVADGNVIIGIGKAVEKLCADGDCTNEIKTGINVVYQLVEYGTTKYIGVTNNFFRRAGEHLSNRGWDIMPIRGLENLSRYDARAVEQALIEYYGLENLYNMINGIAKGNSFYPEALQRGLYILYRIGFIGRQ